MPITRKGPEAVGGRFNVTEPFKNPRTLSAALTGVSIVEAPYPTPGCVARAWNEIAMAQRTALSGGN